MTSRTFPHRHTLLPSLAIALVLPVTSAFAQTPANSDALRSQIKKLTAKSSADTKPTDSKPSAATPTASASNPDLEKLCSTPGNPASDPVGGSRMCLKDAGSGEPRY